MSRGFIALAIAAIIAALGLAGRQDYNQAEADADYYCEMVSAGHWPNYEDRDCE